MSRHYGLAADAGVPVSDGPLAPDATRATTFAMPDADTIRATMQGAIAREVYPRYGHPSSRQFESEVAALEGAEGAVAFASGMAALHAPFPALTEAGDTVALTRRSYGGMAAIAAHELPRLGLRIVHFDPFDPASIAAAAAERPRIWHLETPVNPNCRIVDLPAFCVAARGGVGVGDDDAIIMVDATFLPPPFQRTLSEGADLAIHSATKFLGGHSDLIGGIISGRCELLDPIERYRLRTGPIMGPDTAWLYVRSLKTLPLRFERQQQSAQIVAEAIDGWRAQGKRITAVSYPGLADHPDAATRTRRRLPAGSMMTFTVAGGRDGAAAVVNRLKRIARAVSLGGVETLASLPIDTSHSMISTEELAALGIDPGAIRLSIGIEPPETLIADLAQALAG
jgi:cystathionine beta-lyase/cystathionine gamma-synthase